MEADTRKDYNRDGDKYDGDRRECDRKEGDERGDISVG